MKTLSIVTPVWNEQDSVTELVHRIDEVMKENKITYEIIAIDDRSNDKSVAVLQDLSKSYPVHVYKKMGGQGKAQSLLEGFNHVAYDTIAMIDADLQYAPEYIPEMVKLIDSNRADIVVANRSRRNEPPLRQFLSKLFRQIFVKSLHNLHYDAQSGLKVFRREVIERIQIQPSEWTFDLEFLLRARDAGYKIRSTNITFHPRKQGVSKINVGKAAAQLGVSAVKLRFRKVMLTPFHKKRQQEEGIGFSYKGQDYIHHTALHEKESAFHQLASHQKFYIIMFLILFTLLMIIDWRTTLVGLVGLLTTIYFAQLLFDFYLIQKGYRKQPEIIITESDLKRQGERKWPKYTVLCPLYKEWEVLPQFVTAMSRLEYPKDKLQVLLLLEEDDTETIKHIQSFARNLPQYFQVVIVPDSLPKTKPKACNYGLLRATGEYVVIYDAEDVPHPLQLKQAVVAMEKLDKKTICLQAKLNFYNPHHNILTRIFTAEYSLWFDLVLTGMQAIETPIPLGGTSNHFRTEDLRRLNAWDAFNVTEDADLGIRLAKRGFRTAILNSVTLEEANSHYLNWIKQRSRWIKGYLQTYFVHTRNLSMFRYANKYHQRYTFQLVLGAKILSTLINPFMWLTTIMYFAFRPTLGPTIERFFPGPIYYMGVFCFVFGNFLYLYYYMIGCAKRGHYDLVKYAFLVPFYWLSMSYAGWLAVISLIRDPHYWNKTVHGLHLGSEQALQQSMDTIGRNLVDKKFSQSQLSPA